MWVWNTLIAPHRRNKSSRKGGQLERGLIECHLDAKKNKKCAKITFTASGAIGAQGQLAKLRNVRKIGKRRRLPCIQGRRSLK